ncbi:MAG TPA: RNA polymerase sigma factor [Polyangiaceae bacterium]|nr:RNA polymerase sigma factor [Polyangiaceae bacterium]
MSARPLRPRAVDTSDAELLASVAGGHLGALGELYDRYARDVWRAVRRTLPSGADVDDVVHATFLNLPRIAPSFDGRASCRNWLCGIGVRLAVRHLRGAGRLRRMLGSFAHTLTGPRTSDPEQRASHNQALVALDRALARLSEKKRAVFVLVELEGLSAAEAAAALEIPAVTARTRLFHARRELQAALGEEEGET